MRRNIDHLSDTAFEAHSKQLLRLDSKLHRELPEHFFAEPVYDQIDGIFRGESPLLAVEYLVFADLRSRSLMLDL